MRLSLLLILMLLGLFAPVQAATVAASADGPWNSTSTWSPASVPNSSDDVTIPVGRTVTATSGDFIEANS